eukprot:3408220-Prymnesium_polylepis.1
MSLCRVPCVRAPRFCSKLHTAPRFLSKLHTAAAARALALPPWCAPCVRCACVLGFRLRLAVSAALFGVGPC